MQLRKESNLPSYSFGGPTTHLNITISSLLLQVVGRWLRCNFEDCRAKQDGRIIQGTLDILAGDKNMGLAFGNSWNGSASHVILVRISDQWLCRRWTVYLTFDLSLDVDDTETGDEKAGFDHFEFESRELIIIYVLVN